MTTFGINDPTNSPVTLNEAIRQVVQETVKEMGKKRRNDRGNGSPALANAVREMRMSMGLTTTQFARDIGRDPSLIQKIERGERGMSVETLARISRILHPAPMYIGDILDAIFQTDEASR